MLKLFRNLTKRDICLFLVAVVFIVLGVNLELTMPDYMSKITMLVQTEGSKMSEILLNGGYMLACAFGSMLISILVGYLIARVTSDFSLNTRNKLFNKVLSMGMQDVKAFNTSSLITRTTNDITQLEMVLGMGMQLLIKAPVTAVIAVTKILNKNWQWSLATGIAVVVLLTTIGILTVIVMPKFKIVQKLIDKLNGVTRENLTGIRVVRAFNAEEYQEGKFNDVNNRLTNQQLFNQRTFSIMQPMMYLVMHVLSMSIYFMGAFLIAESAMADKLTIFSEMVVFSSYAMQVIMSFLMIAMIITIMPRANVSANRINEVLDTVDSILDGNVKKGNEEGTVEFKHVYFKYPNAEEYVLEDISFKANKGDVVAFIGSTGSGKSTLINLVPRFYDVTSGEVLVDGVNVKDYDQNSLHNILGYVPQKAVMFNGSVKYNVALLPLVVGLSLKLVFLASVLNSGALLLDITFSFFI